LQEQDLLVSGHSYNIPLGPDFEGEGGEVNFAKVAFLPANDALKEGGA